MKLNFREGTNLQQAMGETVGYVNRRRAIMPPGTVPPFLCRRRGDVKRASDEIREGTPLR